MSTKKTLQKFNKYSINSSPFFELSNKRKLANLLSIDVSILSLGTSKVDLEYKTYVDKKTNRFIQEPYGHLLTIQRRILKFLSRIETPAYLHSAIKKRSYKTNAEAHLLGGNVFKVDIVKFYGAVTFQRVHNFFLVDLKCSPDVATILTKLCTVKPNIGNAHLPTGSCLSPILSYLVCANLFKTIEAHCKEKECIFTLYVDDITVSGKNATPSLMMEIAKEISKNGFSSHKYKAYQNGPALVTGLIVKDGKLHLPHSRAKAIREAEKTLSLTVTPKIKANFLASLIGRLAEAEYIDVSYKIRRHKILEQYRDEWRMITEHRIAKAKLREAPKLRRKFKTIDDIILIPQV